MKQVMVQTGVIVASKGLNIRPLVEDQTKQGKKAVWCNKYVAIMEPRRVAEKK
jgi:hypothetical protein